MGAYVVRRLLHLVAVMLVVSAVTFGLMRAVPGGPFAKEKPLPQEIIDNLNERYHLDDPLIVQYGSYLYDVIIPRFTKEGPSNSVQQDYLVNLNLGIGWFKWMNFGPSYISKSRSVNDIFREQLPVSFQLGIMALLIGISIGLPMGILAALKQNTIFDYFGMAVAIFGVSVPDIEMGPILMFIFAVTLKWFPPTGWGAKPPFLLGFLPSSLGWDYFKYAVLPAFALGTGSSAIIARLARATLLQVIREDYIRTARAKGLKERLVVTQHALKNALIPVVTVLGPIFAAVVTGSFVTELIFGIPGMGRYFVTSISNRDYPVIMGTILLYAILLVLANLAVDLVYAQLDPRIRYD